MGLRKILHFAAVFIILFVGLSTQAQVITIKGNVQDAHSLEPVSFASVYMSVSGIGKISDSSGAFSVTVNAAGADTLIISFVGYEKRQIPLSTLKDTTLPDIQLQRGRSNEVVVKSGINKGLFLWRKIMSKRDQYDRYNLLNFGYEAYNKLQIDIKNFNLDRVKNNIFLKPFSFITDPLSDVSETEGFLPAYLIESISEYAYVRNPKRFYENIKASNTRGFVNENTGKLLGVMNQNVNIYSNYINVVDRDFISPFNDNADRYYIFTVPDTQILNGNKTLHFVFRPKRAGQNTFDGDAWVAAGSWQIQKITLYLGKDANINFVDRISVFQEFSPINDSMIFLTRDKFFADFRVLGKKSLTLTGRKTTSYKNIVINSDSVAALLKTQRVETLVAADTGFTQKTDSAWSRLRHDSLSVHEKAIYTTIDNLQRNPKYKKLQDNFKFFGSGYKNFGKIEVGKWYSLVSGNQWEGTRFQLDLGTNKAFSKNVYLHTYLAYGTLDRKYKGQAEAYWITKRSPNWLSFHFSYLNDIDYGVAKYGEPSPDNVSSFAIRKPNSTRKFINIEDLRLEITKDVGKGFSTQLFASQQTYTPLQNLPSKNNFKTGAGEALNNFELAVRFRFAYQEEFIIGDFFRYSTGTKYPVAEVLFAKGIPGFGKSAYSYFKYSAAISDVVKIAPYGKLSYRLYGGKINGTLPFTFLENHPGNDLYYFNPRAYNLMYRFEYIGDKYGGINLEHNIGSGLFRFIPLTRKLKWRQFWNVKTLWSSLSPTNKALNNTASFFKTLDGKAYMEAGTGIDNIFKVIRLDAVWRVLPQPLPAGKVSRFGLFVSLQFKF